tara:strand:+ start:78 stop:740 length:663 start_codon:yes stop_codon:yes gene_type:complete
MSIFLAIETTTKNCSVALFKNNILIDSFENISEKYMHAERLTQFIVNLLNDNSISFNDISALILSKGPGSYTGLRIGTGTAKGMCYALDLPLISVSTLKAMAYSMAKSKEYDFYCPMINSRRSEFFSALYDVENNEIISSKSDEINIADYDIYKQKKVLFFGQNIDKLKDTINQKNIFFKCNVFPSAKDLGEIGYFKYKKEMYEDLAYFEPFYLKDFILG